MPQFATITTGTALDSLRAGRPIESRADRAKLAGRPTTDQPGDTHGR
jgi:hypothetical protein